MEHTIWKQAHSDALTGLANRRAMMCHLRQAEESFEKDGISFAVALLDLDSFKQVNDNFGHDIGDDLLVEVAGRLTQSAAGGEIVGRLGGDEFLMLMPDVANHEQAAARATAFLSALAKPAKIKNHVLALTASIGVAVQALDGDGAKQLLKAADNALYEMKRLDNGEAKTAELRTVA
jgi:diguanylate cyclase (GGDEF)-like protein